MKITKKVVIITTATMAATGLGTGIALAAWTATGSGSGSGAATVAQSLTVTAVTPSGAAAVLYPGGPAGQVYFTIHNPNPYAVTITGLQWGTPVSTNTTACPSADISVDAGAPTTVSIPVAANTTSGAEQVNGVLDLSHAAPDGCQGVAFDIPVTVTGTQQ